MIRAFTRASHLYFVGDDQIREIQKALFLWLDKEALDPAAFSRFFAGMICLL